MEQEQTKLMEPLKSDEVRIVKANREAEYIAFTQWIAMPAADKKKINILTQKDFSKQFSVQYEMLSEWKKRPDFWKLVTQNTLSWAKMLTPTVIHALFKRSLKQDFGNPKDTELWLQYVEGFAPKQIQEHKLTHGLTENDIRLLVAYLPLEEQQEFYGTLARLIERAKHLRALRENGEGFVNGRTSDTLDISGEADIADETNSPGRPVAEEAQADIRRHLEEQKA